MPMIIEAVPADQLTDGHIRRWRQLQAANPSVQSPFFSPEYTQAVASVRRNTEVVLFQQGNEIMGFLPFQRGRWNVGRPVGDLISEIHGVVSHDRFDFDHRQLLRSCGLSAWRFDCLPAWQIGFAPSAVRQSEFPYIDISEGFSAYCDQRRRAGSATIAQAMRKTRKIERELGPLRLELKCTDEQILKTLLDWKALQYQRIGVLNLAAIPWIVQLQKRLCVLQTEHFSGAFTVLYLRDTPIAAHIGICANGILAWCFPSYDPAYTKYSPGLVLLVKLLEAAPRAGITRIDLGQGDEQYKASFSTGSFAVSEGSLERWSVNRLISKSWIHMRERVKSLPLSAAPLRVLRRFRNLAMNN